MCSGRQFKTVMNLGRHPLVNNLVEKNDLDKAQPTFPLVLKQCQQCFLVQLKDAVHTSAIYRAVDYVYFSSDMPGLKDYYAELVADIEQRFLGAGDFFVEIGSNDGIVLDLVKDTTRVLGVDPATNVVLRALRKGLPTLSEFFSNRLARQIRFEWGPAKVILGANSFAHVDDLHDMMKGAVALLQEDGVLIVEANYWGRMVESTNCALIYHDHFSYFTLKNWVDFAGRFGLTAFDALVTAAQGGSLRVFLGRGFKPTERFRDLLAREVAENLNSYATAERYRKAVQREAKKLGTLVRRLKAQGKRIAGYGAAAKGFTVLKLAGIDRGYLEYFADDSPAKQGKYTPVSHTPIVSRQEAKTPDYFLITAPNYEEIIVRKERRYLEEGGRFITVDSRIIGATA